MKHYQYFFSFIYLFLIFIYPLSSIFLFSVRSTDQIIFLLNCFLASRLSFFLNPISRSATPFLPLSAPPFAARRLYSCRSPRLPTESQPLPPSLTLSTPSNQSYLGFIFVTNTVVQPLTHAVGEIARLLLVFQIPRFYFLFLFCFVGLCWLFFLRKSRTFFFFFLVDFFFNRYSTSLNENIILRMYTLQIREKNRLINE